MVLSSQTFQNSYCLETNPGYAIQNGSLPVVFESNPEKEWIQDAYNNSEARRIIEKTLYRDGERSFVGTFHNSSGDTVSRKDLNVPETCHTSVTTVIAIIVITLSMFCSCMESITISGTGLKEESPIALSFWSYVFGISFSLSFHFIFENTIIPDNTTDILLYFGHGILASGVTYFDILALQNIDVNLRYITTSLTLPLSFVLQLTILHNVSPSANMWLLVSGMIIVFVCALTSPIYEYVHLKRNKSKPLP